MELQVPFLECYQAAGQQLNRLVAEWMQHRPHRLFAELRAASPFFSTPNFLIVSRFPDVQEVLNQEMIFSVRLYAERMDSVAGPFMLTRDGTIFNERDKSILKTLFRREDLPVVREKVSRLTTANLAAFKQPEGIELVSSLSRRVPLQLCGDYFGFPGPDLESMMRWSRAIQMDLFHNRTGNPAVHEGSVAAGREMRTYLQDHLANRLCDIKHNPALDDILCRLLKLQLPKELGFDAERICANTMGLLIGAGETSSQSIIQVLDQFLRRPQIMVGAVQAAQAGHDALLGQYVWEALRFNPISPGIVRYCEENVLLARGTERETLVKKGTVVFAATLSAMFDEKVMDQPEEFRLDRPSSHYFHFGHGHHLCLGNYVSLVMIPEVIKHLLLQKNLRRADGERGRVHYKGGPFPEEFWVNFDGNAN